MLDATRIGVPAGALVPRLVGSQPAADGDAPGVLTVEALGMQAFARARLPAPESRALHMVEVQGATYQEVARCLATSRDAVKELVYRGRQQLLDDVECTRRALALMRA